MLSPVRPSVRPSVCHTDGSVKTVEVRFPLSGGVKQGWDGENKLFSSFMSRLDISKTVRDRPTSKVTTND